MGLCALGFVGFREPAIRLFIKEGTAPEVAAEMVRVGAWVMVLGAVFQVFDAMGITLTGALRGAGDTVVPGVVAMVLAWTLIVGVGTALTFLAPELESIGPWMAASAYIIAYGLFIVVRFLRGRWKTIDVLGEAEGNGTAQIATGQ